MRGQHHPIPHLTEAQAREEICRVGQSLFDRGYVHATAGNISVRLEHGFLITPTDACLGYLEPDDLALLDAQGQQLSGKRASKPWLCIAKFMRPPTMRQAVGLRNA